MSQHQDIVKSLAKELSQDINPTIAVRLYQELKRMNLIESESILYSEVISYVLEKTSKIVSTHITYIRKSDDKGRKLNFPTETDDAKLEIHYEYYPKNSKTKYPFKLLLARSNDPNTQFVGTMSVWIDNGLQLINYQYSNTSTDMLWIKNRKDLEEALDIFCNPYLAYKKLPYEIQSRLNTHDPRDNKSIRVHDDFRPEVVTVIGNLSEYAREKLPYLSSLSEHRADFSYDNYGLTTAEVINIENTALLELEGTRLTSSSVVLLNENTVPVNPPQAFTDTAMNTETAMDSVLLENINDFIITGQQPQQVGEEPVVTQEPDPNT
jgi:hypothetical protein